jgi:hypothetical protein
MRQVRGCLASVKYTTTDNIVWNNLFIKPDCCNKQDNETETLAAIKHRASYVSAGKLKKHPKALIKGRDAR